MCFPANIEEIEIFNWTSSRPCSCLTLWVVWWSRDGRIRSEQSPTLRSKITKLHYSSCGFIAPSYLSPHPAHQPPHQNLTLSLGTNRWGEGFFPLLQTLTCWLYRVEIFKEQCHFVLNIFIICEQLYQFLTISPIITEGKGKIQECFLMVLLWFFCF